MIPESQMAASLRVSTQAEFAGITVRLEPGGSWQGSPHVGWWGMLYAVGLAIRRLRRIRSWRVVTTRGDTVVTEQLAPDRASAELLGLQALKDAVHTS